MARIASTVGGDSGATSKMNRDVVKLLAAIKQAAKYPDRFTDAERGAMCDLLGVYIGSPDNWVAIRAAEAVIAMEASNIAAERLSGTLSESEPWATRAVPTRDAHGGF